MPPHYLVLCTVCNSSFPAYEEYVDHLLKDHNDNLALHMKYKIVHS